MKTTIEYRQQQYSIDLSKPLDISLTLRGDDRNPIAWYLKSPRIEPVREGEWIGKVSQGSSTNFNNIYFNPHGNTRMDATITELIYAPSKIEDGRYFLNLQIASFENDAAPSKPVLYKIE